MAIDDLPGPVVTFLNVLGVPWPYISDDAVRQFGAFSRQFGQAVQATHEDSTRQVQAIAQSYRSASSDAMLNGWQALSARHVSEIVEGCSVLAVALDAAADFIVAQKLAALAQLTEMAVEFLAAQATAVETLGISEAGAALAIEAGERVIASLEQDVQQYLLGQVGEAALKPLLSKVSQALDGLDWSRTGAAAGKGGGLELDSAETRARAQALRSYAWDMRSHAATFSSRIEGLAF